MPIIEQQLRLASSPLDNAVNRLELSIPDIHCGGCIRKIETAVGKLDKVHDARVNLSTKRLSVQWRNHDGPPTALFDTLSSIGFDAHLGTAESGVEHDAKLKYLYRALAVAAFAAMNIMMLSIAVWAGASGSSRQLFHWLSAIIAFPALAYSGSYFFSSAFRALRSKQTNMDVPISLGLIITFLMSLFDTITHKPDVYFDAATSLLFFLLVGRTLDHLMRKRSRSAIEGLMKMSPKGATVIHEGGTREYLPVSDIVPGMRLIVPVGERVPVDGIVDQGTSDIDMSLISGESRLSAVSPGLDVVSGVLNVGQPLTITASKTVDRSFMADMIRLMEVAEQSKSGYRQIADRLSSYYAPLVHTAALATLIIWYLISADLHHALSISVSVLIITCPCALALAVPMVQIMASKTLFKHGILMKSGSGLERLSEVNHIVFDKTGTLTLGKPGLINMDVIEPFYLSLAANMAMYSSHPYCKALQDHRSGHDIEFTAIRELPGQGMEAQLEGRTYFYGRAADSACRAAGKTALQPDSTVLSCDGNILCVFEFEDTIRPETLCIIEALRDSQINMSIVSGDQVDKVEAMARQIGIPDFQGSVKPSEKMSYIEKLIGEGEYPLMIGDGINDAPALTLSHASMAPGSAADIGRSAADFVYLDGNLSAIPTAIGIAKQTRTLSRQNIIFAIAYNIIAIPIACIGLVTPLIAAIAMSASSLIVIGNAMRVGQGRLSNLQAGR